MRRRNVPEVIFEDDYLISVNKPADLLSIPGRDVDEDSVYTWLHRMIPEVFIVHRIDRDTSGVLIFAKDAGTHKALSVQFARHEVTKTYLAVVAGRPPEDQFAISYKIAVRTDGKACVSQRGKSAETRCRVVERFSRHSLVEIMPVTGRQHQIRVHLAHLGYPLAVDPLYGSADVITIGDLKPALRKSGTVGTVQGNLMARTPLHAWSIGLRHPGDGQDLRIEAEIPKDMRALLRQLRKWS